MCGLAYNFAEKLMHCVVWGALALALWYFVGPTPAQAQLNEKFEQDGWSDRLQELVRVEVAPQTIWATGRGPQTGAQGRRRIREQGTKFRDADGNTRVRIIDYTHDDGTSFRAVRMLRDDAGTQWDVAQ